MCSLVPDPSDTAQSEPPNPAEKGDIRGYAAEERDDHKGTESNKTASYNEEPGGNPIPAIRRSRSQGSEGSVGFAGRRDEIATLERQP